MEHQTSANQDRLARSGTVLCADDFAQSSSISAAIGLLARSGRVDAVSAMTIKPNWLDDARLLDSRAANVQVGLHLVLCDERPLGPMPNSSVRGFLPPSDLLARRALTRRLDASELSQEIARQFDAFEQGMGHPPDFVDGHKHCHLLPGLRELVLHATVKRAPNAWLRSCADRLSSILSRPFRWKAAGSALWSTGFSAAARRRGLITNDSFAGHYDFKRDYAPLLPQFCSRPGHFHVIMCHPGDGRDGDDPIATARAEEFSVLNSLAR